MADCKSPTHRRYAEAIEDLYIQTALAEQDLATILAEVRVENPKSPGSALNFVQHRVDWAIERITKAQRRVEQAIRDTDAHFDRGCRNLASVGH